MLILRCDALQAKEKNMDEKIREAVFRIKNTLRQSLTQQEYDKVVELVSTIPEHGCQRSVPTQVINVAQQKMISIDGLYNAVEELVHLVAGEDALFDAMNNPNYIYIAKEICEFLRSDLENISQILGDTHI